MGLHNAFLSHPLLRLYLESEHDRLLKCTGSQKFSKRTLCAHATRSTRRRGISGAISEVQTAFQALGLSTLQKSTTLKRN